MLIPGHVAELHLRSEDLPEAQALLIRWIVDRLLDDIYEHHDIMWVTDEKVQGSAISSDQRHALPIIEMLLLGYMIGLVWNRIFCLLIPYELLS